MIKNKIMVVEDESIVAEHIRKSLENMGHSVTSVASSGEKAIKDAKDKTPDLVLMDIVLDGELDGIETAKLIRSLFNIPVVFLTAYSDEKILERAKITEPFGYLIKPFNDTDLRLSLIHISEPTRLGMISYAVFCLKKKKKQNNKKKKKQK